MSHLAAGTIVTKNYLSYARVLANSFREYHPDVPFFTLLADEGDGYFAPSMEPFHLVRVADLKIPNLTSFLFKNSQQQVAIAVKPYFLLHLLGQGFGGAIFLDADILVLNDLSALLEKVSKHAIVLTPHFLAPLEGEGRAERELTVLQSGVYNAGFVGVSDGTASRQFLDWWQDRLYDHCHHNVPQGMMFDQRWLDLSVAFFDDVCILRDSSYNVAYWNLPERSIRIDEDRIIVTDQPCRFFHFSGFEPDRPHAVSKYSPRLSMDNVGPAAALFRRYLALLEAAGYHESKAWPYAFGHFDHGVAIPAIARQMYQRLGEEAHEFGDPFETGRSGSYYEWLNGTVEGECEGSSKITRLWRAIYEQRGDVQRAYPDVRGADREGFLAWAARYGVNEHRIPEQFLPLAVARSGASAMRTCAQLDKAGGARTVSVAVVTCNTRDYLRACLDSVLAEAPGEVVVVDNASTDGTPEMVRTEYPHVALYANTTNYGYAAAANQAVKNCRGDYVLLLNGDAWVAPGAIGVLGAYMDRHPEAAVVGPLLRHPDGSLQRSYFPFPGTLRWLLENEPVVWLLRSVPVGRERFLCFTSPTVDRVVPWVLGAALLLRRTAFEAVGGFDESYFMYFEEVDLCLRLRALQFQVHFTPSATVVHVNGASTSQCRREMRIAHFRSCDRFYRRHYSHRRAGLWMALMKLKIATLLARDVVRLRIGSDEPTRVMLTQHVDAWKALLRGLPE